MSEDPMRFSLGLISCNDFLTGKFTPCTFCNYTTDAISDYQAFGSVGHNDRVVQVEVEHDAPIGAYLLLGHN